MSDEAIPAATLVVWRDPTPGDRQDAQILVVERSASMAFAAGAIVFPGGRIDPADHELAARLGRPGEAAKITAIRETIEESSVIAGLLGHIQPSLGRKLQADLIEGREFSSLLSEHDLHVDFDALTPFARWMPAFKQPRKFDTLFFLTAAPEGQWDPIPQPGECVAAEWASPSELIDRIGAGAASAIFPTKRNLERLAESSHLAAALSDARAHSLETIIPWVEDINGEPHVRIPDDRGYPVTAEPLTTAFRA
jgi:8-oxo-dGTP pyrophosphatase MutT (NUDIX family)